MALDTKIEISLRPIPKQFGITKPTGVAMSPLTTAKLPKSYLRKEQASLKEFLYNLNETIFQCPWQRFISSKSPGACLIRNRLTKKNAVTGRTNLGKVQNEKTEKMANNSGRKRHG